MVNEISNGLSNGKRSEAVESDVGVRVEVDWCEAESGSMRVIYPFHLITHHNFHIPSQQDTFD